ncbi:hypothetical protein EV195_11821, partial [Tenacibaculum skagerrakense]
KLELLLKTKILKLTFINQQENYTSFSTVFANVFVYVLLRWFNVNLANKN